MRFLKTILGASLVGIGLLVASMTAFAATSTTTLSLTIPTSITLSGVAASYSGTGPAGVATVITNGPLTIQTNSSLGYTFTVTPSTNVFTAGTLTFPVQQDVVSTTCPTGATCSAAGGLVPTGQQLVKTSTATSATGDAITVTHTITPPAGQAPGTYSVGLSYVATAN